MEMMKRVAFVASLSNIWQLFVVENRPGSEVVIDSVTRRTGTLEQRPPNTTLTYTHKNTQVVSAATPLLALLVCDTPIPAVIATHGDYERIFKTFFLKSLPDGLDAFNMDAFDVRGKKEYPAEDRLDDYDGIVITGSAASAYEDVEWINKLVAWVARIATSKPQIKIIGICFGHQIVARALGGTCVPNDGKWEVGITDIALTDVGQRIFKTGTFNIQQMHRDHVPSVPPSFYLLGSTPVSLNQGMVRFVDSASSPDLSQPLPPIHILTLQGHPEFTKELVNELVDARSASGILDQATAQQARDRADWRNDGPSVMGRALWEVLRA